MNRRLYKGLCVLAIAAGPAIAGLVGCSDLGEPIKLIPRPEVSPTTVNFGTVAVSASATRTVTVGNTGTGVLDGFASVRCPVYTIQSGGGAFNVPPGGQHVVVVVYTPTGTGDSPCQLLLGADIPPVDLNGAGALQPPGAQCVLSDTTLDFGSSSVGSSKQDGFTISNPGTASLILDVVPTCGDFVVVTGGGPSTLEPGGTLAVGVQFVPQTGGQISCSIAVGPGLPEVRVHGSATSASFATDIAPILASLSFTRGCAGCHAFRTQADLVNVPAGAYRPNVYIKPFDLVNSVLYQKITNTGRFGQAMPFGTSGLPAADADKFRRWILEGALNN